MTNPFTRRRCWGLTTLPVIGLGVTSLVEYLGVPQTGVVRLVLYLGFVAVVVGSGAAFLAWGKYVGLHGRPRLGTALERGVGVVFTAWIGWSLLLEITHTGLPNVAALEALVLGTAVVGDAYLAVLLTQTNVSSGEDEPRPTVSGLLTGTVLLAFAVLWQLLSRRWSAASLVTLVVALGILGVQIVRLKRRTNPSSLPSRN